MAAEPLIRFPDGRGSTLAGLIASCEPGAIVEIAPGRYTEQLELTRPITVRGAGELTRLSGDRRGPLCVVRGAPDAQIILDSLAFEDGAADDGGALRIERGKVRLNNLHMRRCRAGAGGGAIAISDAQVEASRLRIVHVEAARGGAIRVFAAGALNLSDAEISHCQAAVGGALAIEDGAVVVLERVTIARTRATEVSGGQALYVGGSGQGRPMLRMRRVRLQDAPIGLPLVNSRQSLGEIHVAQCDMPRMVLETRGLMDEGENRWR